MLKRLVTLSAILTTAPAFAAQTTKVLVPIDSRLPYNLTCSDRGEKDKVHFSVQYGPRVNSDQLALFYWNAFKVLYDKMVKETGNRTPFEHIFSDGPSKMMRLEAPSILTDEILPRSSYNYDTACKSRTEALSGARSYLNFTFIQEASRPFFSCDGRCTITHEYQLAPSYRVQLKNGKVIEDTIRLYLYYPRSSQYVDPGQCRGQTVPVCPEVPT